MKKLLFLLLVLPALATAKVPDEEDIINNILNAESPYYYTSLMMRYNNAADSTLTDNDYHYLYYGYAYDENYKPLETNPDLDKLLMLAARLDIDNPSVETLEAMIGFGNDALKRDPFSPKVLNLMAYAYGALENEAMEKMYYAHMNGVIRTIQQSGDALTQNTPRHIIMFDHALDVLSFEGLPYGKSRVVSRTVEFVELAADYVVDGKKRKGMYFNYERIYRNKPEGYTFKRDRTWQFNNLKPRTYK